MLRSTNIYWNLVLAVSIALTMVSVVSAQGTTKNTTAPGSTTTLTSIPEESHAPKTDALDDESSASKMKIMSMVVIGGVGIIVDLVVIAFPQLKTNPFVMSIVASFGAGIFIVVGVGHMLPSGVDQIAASMDAHTVARFRPGFMVAIAGYFFMVMIQRGLFKVAENMNDATEDSLPSVGAENGSLSKGYSWA